jgi:hypothetical protein
MNLNDTLVVLDTCVLLMPRVADVLMDLRAEKLFSVHWTEHIDAEFVRNMHGVYGIAPAKVESRLRAMKARCPEWEVLLCDADWAGVPKGVDAKDRHVAAAALALRHAVGRIADEDEHRPGNACDVILVSENTRDMATRQMAKLGVRVLRAGAFLNEVCDAQPEATKRAIHRAANDLKKPPYTVQELLDVLRQAGADTLVAHLSAAPALTPPAAPDRAAPTSPARQTRRSGKSR